MATPFTEKSLKEQLAALCPTVDNLRNMLGAARHAFNRNRAAELEEMARLQDIVTLDLDLVFEKVEKALERPGEAEKPYWLRLQGIITHLEIIGANIAALEGPLRKKTRSNIFFSDNDALHLNHLFVQHAGLLRGLTDVFQSNDRLLKQYLVSECENLLEGCFTAAADHQARMMDGFGQLLGWSVYLAMLDHSRIILQHLIDIVKLLG